jgi:thiol-disulfide isomerase/thioredoxin
MKYLIAVIFLININIVSEAQTFFVDSCVQFNLKLRVDNAYNDTITYTFFDCNKNESGRKKIILKKGRGVIEGSVNRSTEMVVFCDPKAKYDDSSYYRLLIEPGDISVHLRMKGNKIVSQKTVGLNAQKDRQEWMSKNANLLMTDNNLLEEFRFFLRSKTDSLTYNDRIKGYNIKFDSLNKCKLIASSEFIQKNQDSYQSIALLFQYNKRYSTDSLLHYFKTLSLRVQQSNLGKYVFDELSKRVDDYSKLMLFFDTAYYYKLNALKNIYDASLVNRTGEMVSFTDFKGKVTLIDFWDSGCPPCIREMPLVKKIAEDYSQFPLEVVSVSMDKNENTWKETITRFNFDGVQLLDKEKILSTYFKVMWVPRYVLIDKTGNVVTIDAPRPGTPELINLIEKLLQ